MNEIREPKLGEMYWMMDTDYMPQDYYLLNFTKSRLNGNNGNKLNLMWFNELNDEDWSHDVALGMADIAAGRVVSSNDIMEDLF